MIKKNVLNRFVTCIIISTVYSACAYILQVFSFLWISFKRPVQLTVVTEKSSTVFQCFVHPPTMKLPSVLRLALFLTVILASFTGGSAYQGLVCRNKNDKLCNNHKLYRCRSWNNQLYPAWTGKFCLLPCFFSGSLYKHGETLGCSNPYCIICFNGKTKLQVRVI